MTPRDFFNHHIGPGLLESWPEDVSDAFSCVQGVLERQGFSVGAPIVGRSFVQSTVMGRHVCALVQDPVLGRPFYIYMVLSLTFEDGADVSLLLDEVKGNSPTPNLADLFARNWGHSALAHTSWNWNLSGLEWEAAKLHLKTWLTQLFSTELETVVLEIWPSLSLAHERAAAP